MLVIKILSSLVLLAGVNPFCMQKLDVITCSNFSSLSTLLQELESLELTDNRDFMIEDSTLYNLPAKAFSKFPVYNNEVKKIHFSNLHIQTIHSEAFYGFKSLEEMYLNNNEILKIAPGVYNSSDILRILNLANNRIYKIERNALMGANNLQELHLSHNSLMDIEEDTFTTSIVDDVCQSLKMLDLSFNMISTIAIGAFWRLCNLQELYLQGNHIGKIHNNFFVLATSLKRLNFSHNYVEIIDYGVFNKLENLQELDMSFNPISKIKPQAFVNLHTLKKTYLEYKEIQEIDRSLLSRTLSKLRLLGISYQKPIKDCDCTEIVKAIETNYQNMTDEMQYLNGIFIFFVLVIVAIGLKKICFPLIKYVKKGCNEMD